MSTMAEVLAAHQLCVAWEDEASQGITCLCGFEIQTEKVRNEIDMDFLAAHQADALTKAGYGKLADAFPIIRDLADPDDCWFDHHGGCQAHGYLSLEPGETCPQHDAKEWLKANDGSAS